MIVRRLVIASLVVAAFACDGGGTPPVKTGSLDSKITKGEVQSLKAGAPMPEFVVDQVFRPTIGAAAPRKLPLWERVLLPAVAWAQSVGIIVQPNSVVCVLQPYGQLVPEKPCVNSDAQGNARFDFLQTTKAGTHKALIGATFGVETTVPDTVTITVQPDVPDPDYRSGVLPLRCSPAQLPADVVRDKYANAIPFRIVGDGRITVQGDTIGTVAARTVEFSAAQIVANNPYFVTELRGAGDILVGRLQYQVYSSQGSCPNGAPYINWSTAGTNQLP